VQPDAWSAVMPIVLAPRSGNSDWRVELRRKKYPAVAANEVFNPSQDRLEPIFRSNTVGFDVRAYTNELICSEVFLVTSPANLLGMVHGSKRLHADFGISSHFTVEKLIEDIVQDIMSFARFTSLSHAIDQPRLLLLVPAMTTRSVDYSVLGQAGFLASAITTVFCNAVAFGFGCGQSCIVGHDGWGKEGKERSGVPGAGPYHGVVPGIFHPNHFNSGRLGKEEQALIIADIDPVYSPEGKPRPQMLPPPLALVAHLPIIETSFPTCGAPKCTCVTGRENTTEAFRAFARRLTEHFSTDRPQVSTTGNDREPQRLSSLLNELAGFVSARAKNRATDSTAIEERAGWMARRNEAYLREHLAAPRRWPPPAAIDWLWVDSSIPATGLPKLEVPPYSLAPGEIAETR
jgi:hypothetical protein